MYNPSPTQSANRLVIPSDLGLDCACTPAVMVVCHRLPEGRIDAFKRAIGPLEGHSNPTRRQSSWWQAFSKVLGLLQCVWHTGCFPFSAVIGIMLMRLTSVCRLAAGCKMTPDSHH